MPRVLSVVLGLGVDWLHCFGPFFLEDSCQGQSGLRLQRQRGFRAWSGLAWVVVFRSSVGMSSASITGLEKDLLQTLKPHKAHFVRMLRDEIV